LQLLAKRAAGATVAPPAARALPLLNVVQQHALALLGRRSSLRDPPRRRCKLHHLTIYIYIYIYIEREREREREIERESVCVCERERERERERR
jgi:hypothetical protein